MMRKILILISITFVFLACDNETSENLQTQIDDAIYVTANDSKVYALDISNGTKKWEFDLGNNSRGYCTLLSKNGLLYATSVDNFKFFALNANTGIKKWEYTSDDYLFSYNCISEDEKTIFLGGWSGKLIALDALSGAIKWNISHTENVDNITEKNGIVYYTTDDKKLHAVNANTGANKWTKTSTNSFTACKVINNKLYVGNGKSYLALDAVTGNQVWNFTPTNLPVDAFVETAPIVHNGILYGILYKSNSTTYAINAANGSELWNYSFPDNSYESPYFFDNALYFKSYNGLFTALNATNGSVNWQKATSIYGATLPIVKNNKIYVGSSGSDNPTHNGVYALSTSNGDILWRFATTKRVSNILSAAINNEVYNANIID